MVSTYPNDRREFLEKTVLGRQEIPIAQELLRIPHKNLKEGKEHEGKIRNTKKRRGAGIPELGPF